MYVKYVLASLVFCYSSALLVIKRKTVYIFYIFLVTEAFFSTWQKEICIKCIQLIHLCVLKNKSIWKNVRERKKGTSMKKDFADNGCVQI